MPFTSIADFEATESPTFAETELIEACRAGEPCILGDGTLPPEGKPNPDREIRAKLLRLLILGGTPDCGLHPIGVMLQGGHIIGQFDLSFTTAHGRCALDTCRFDLEPQFAHTQLAQLSLQGSHLPGLFGQGIKVEGDVLLIGLTAKGTIDVSSARIGGQLACSDADFDGGQEKDGGHLWALNAQGLVVGENLFLDELAAKGTVDLNGAQIGGQLVCQGAEFDGGLDKDGMRQGALMGQRLHVAQGFFFRKVGPVVGQIYLYAAHVGDFHDDIESWPIGEDQIFIDGFSYDRVAWSSALTFAARKNWLEHGSRYKGRFYPQPYTQFAKVLREMGHAAEARKVLMERDRVLFAESHKENRAALQAAKMHNRGDVGLAWLRLYRLKIWDWFTYTASGYGHAPHRALFWSMGCIGFGAVWFFLAWQAGVMVPNSDVILTSAEWSNAMALNHDAPTAAWGGMNAATHYETFYSLPYALDVFVPLVSIGQEAAWSASTVCWFGWATRVFTFLFQIAGWAITALGIAAITGFVQKNQPD